jgi:D-alanyl-D-alanine carboxypeptidase
MKKNILLPTAFSVCLTVFSGCNAVEQINDETVSAGLDIISTDTVSGQISETGIYSENTDTSDILSDNDISSETDIITETSGYSSVSDETVSSSSLPESSQQTQTHEVSGEKSISLSQQSVTLMIDETVSVEASGSFSSLKWSSTDSTIASVDSDGNIKGINDGSCTIMVQDKNSPEISASLRVTVKSAEETTMSYSVNGVTSLTYVSGILIANKTYALPSDYAPGVDEDAMAAFTEMQQAAYAEGYSLYIASGYRSYDTQKSLYESYVARDGKQAADTYSSRPGYSEHQTGLAFDLNSVDISFANTPEGKWVAENCYKYGFIIRYPENKSAITGYMYEPWHIRYLGVNIATSVYQSGLCLEEYLGITSFYEDDIQY